jgi:hypothetical protein
MKHRILVCIGLFASSLAYSTALPEFIEGPIWGHLASTEPFTGQISSHPRRQVYGVISNGALTFGLWALSDFERRDTAGLVEYTTKTEKVDFTLGFREPFQGRYTITIKTPEGGYERYNLKMTTMP